jgi:hypothetical protein
MRRAALLTAALSLAILGSPVVSASAMTPTLGQVVPAGTMVEGQCTLNEGVESGRKTSWEIDGMIPAFRHGGNGGVQLAPRAEDMPRLAHTPTDVFGGSFVVVPNLLASPQRPSGNCVIQSFDPLQATTMEEAGPHLLVQYDESVHFVWVPDGSDDPVPQPCPLNDTDFPDPGDVQPPTMPDTGGHWAPDSFCNATAFTGFYVSAKSDCPASGDMSQWPSPSPYISQYDAGARLNLPLGSGRRGGNACGPSSLLMAMLSGGPTGLPSLEDTFDATMRLNRVQVQPGGDNVFWGDPRGVALAKSLGFRQARTRALGTNVQDMERTILTSLHVGGGNTPVVISTAFGGARWGVTGGGHMIAIVGADGRGGWIVEDPAGNYFSTPKPGYSDTSGGHYGPGSCGHRAVYPHYWLLAYTTGRWLLELGPRTLPPPSPRPGRAHAAADASLGSAFSVADENPGGADAPTSFWLQDSSGRRAGFIDGQPVEEIPDSAVGQDPPGWTDPAIGDDTIGPPAGDPPRAPRSVVVNGRAGEFTVHDVQGAGAAFALRAESWDSGKRVGSDALTGTGTGADSPVAAPSPAASPTPAATTARLSASKAKVRRRVVSVPLECTAPAGASCRFAIKLTAKKGRRTVTISKKSGTLAGGKKLTVRLKPTAAGRRLMKSKRRIAATLTVTQTRAAAKALVVRRQKLKV